MVIMPPAIVETHPHSQEHFFRMLDRALAIKYTHHVLGKHRRGHPMVNSHAMGTLKPRLDIIDDPGTSRIICQVEVPGVKKDDVSLVVQGKQLVISGTRRQALGISEVDPRKPNYLVREVKYGKFRREVLLPSNFEPREVSASISDGMLTISWPRVSASTEMPRPIEVTQE